jgi:hypothetical protein
MVASVLHCVAIAAAIVTVGALFGPSYAAIPALVIAVGYIMGYAAAAHRARLGELAGIRRAAAYLTAPLFGFTHMIVGSILVLVVVAALLVDDLPRSAFAAAFEHFQETVFFSASSLVIAVTIRVALSAILISLAIFVFVRARQSGFAGAFRAMFRQFARRVTAQLLFAMAAGLALTGLALSFAWILLEHIGTVQNYPFAGSFFHLSAAYPSVLIGVLGGILALLGHRLLALRSVLRNSSETVPAESETGQRLRMRTMILVFVMTVAGAASLFGQYRVLHNVFQAAVSGLSSLPAFLAINSVIRWSIVEFEESGEMAEELVRRLNGHGEWRSDRPGTGVAEVLPRIDEMLPKLASHMRCRLDFSAGTIAPEDVERINQTNRYWYARKHIAIGESNAKGEFPILKKVRFCFRVDCHSTYLGKESGISYIFSSHRGRTEGWAGGVFATDMFFDRPFKASGYCRADGSLSENLSR